jgi:hypothetical protein
MPYEMTVKRDGAMIDTIESDAPDPQSAEADMRAIAADEYGDNVELTNLRRKGATGV